MGSIVTAESQLGRVLDVLSDRRQHVIGEIQSLTGDLPQSITSRIRDLRTRRYGSHRILKIRLKPGVFAYQLGR